MKDIKEIEFKIQKLPSGLLEELDHYIDYLLSKGQNASKEDNKLSQKWAGSLKEYRDQYTAVNLQKEALK